MLPRMFTCHGRTGAPGHTRSALEISTIGLAALIVLCACSDSGHDGHGEPSGTTDEPAHPAGDVSCVDDARVEVLSAEAQVIEKSGDLGVLEFSVLATEPFPPIKGDNTFRIQIRDEQGAVMSGELLVEATMPDHGHGARVAPQVSYDQDEQVYVITPLNFFMPGVWQVELQCPNPDSDGVIDSAQFTFCIEG